MGQEGKEMTIQEVQDKLKALDAREDIELTTWECGFIESLLNQHGMSSAQFLKAIEILERYEVEGDGGQEVIVKGPEDIMKHLRKRT